RSAGCRRASSPSSRASCTGDFGASFYRLQGGVADPARPGLEPFSKEPPEDPAGVACRAKDERRIEAGESTRSVAAAAAVIVTAAVVMGAAVVIAAAMIAVAAMVIGAAVIAVAAMPAIPPVASAPAHADAAGVTAPIP